MKSLRISGYAADMEPVMSSVRRTRFSQWLPAVPAALPPFSSSAPGTDRQAKWARATLRTDGVTT